MNRSFDFQPTLTGDLVQLRPLLELDYDQLRRVAGDPLIWEQHPVPDRWRAPRFDDYFRQRIARGGTLVVTDRSASEVIGATEFHDFRPEMGQIEIGASFLARRYWGGAYNGEMKRLMTGHAFRFVDSVVFAVSERNLRSQRALLKIGAIAEQSLIRNGLPYLLFRMKRDR